MVQLCKKGFWLAEKVSIFYGSLQYKKYKKESWAPKKRTEINKI